MSNYQYTQDLLDDVLGRADEPIDGTSEYATQAKTFLNRALLGLTAGGAELADGAFELWYWLKPTTRGVLTLNPVIETGTVLVTNNSTSITFSSAPTPSVATRYFRVTGHPDVFKISAHTALAAGATLDSVYTGTTDATANYKVFQLEYSLASDVLYLGQEMRAYQSSRKSIKGISEEELDRLWPLHVLGQGVPRNFAMIAEQKVRFSHYGGTSSTDLIRIDYQYAAQPTLMSVWDSSTEPPFPHRHRKVIADWALALLLQAKSDSRSAEAMQLARSGFKAMVRENRWRKQQAGDNYGQIITRPESTPLMQEPLRTESGYII